MRTIILMILLAAPLQAASIFDIPAPMASILNGVSATSAGQTLHLAMEFDRIPDFTTMDDHGRAAESFQWYLTDDLTAPRPMNSNAVDFIVRPFQTLVLICTAKPFGAGCAGGWGVPLGFIQPVWDGTGRFLTLDVPTDLLGGSLFAYDVISTRYGAQDDWFTGQVGGNAVRMGGNPTVAPETASWVLLGIGLAGIVLAGRRKGRLTR